jgi:putative ABC transport system permease protein
MTLSRLAIRNAFLRNKTRAFLTVLGVTVAALAFVFLRTVLAAWYASSESSASDRLVVRNAISLTEPLPVSYRDRIAQVPGVSQVTFSNWFGGIYKDRRNFFAQFAIDAPTALEVFDVRFVQGSKEAFLADRNSCVVGKGLAERYGFKLGDTIPLQGDVYPGEWRFKVAGIVESDDPSTASTLHFHWQRLNEDLPQERKNLVGAFTVKVADAAQSPRVIEAIDDLFANSDAETHTEAERSFRLQFLTGSSAIVAAIEAVSAVVLVIMALILGNTLAMGLRERTSEMGAMRAIGFPPKHVRLLAWSEGALLGLVGGLAGVILARPVLIATGKALASMGFPINLGFRPATAALTLLAATAVGTLASAFPARAAARMEVVTALRRQE